MTMKYRWAYKPTADAIRQLWLDASTTRALGSAMRLE